MTAKISVLMFTYHTQAHRRLQWLPEAVESILTQDVDLELLLCDNGSEPSLMPYLSPLVERDNRVSLFRVEPNSIVEAHRVLRSNVKTPYTCFMCDDDTLTAGTLKRCCDVLDAMPQFGVVWGESSSRVVDFDRIFAHHQCPFPGTVFRSQYLNLWAKYSQYATGDWMFWVDVLSKTMGTCVPIPSVNVRFHQDSWTEREGYGEGKFVREHLIMWRQWLEKGYRPPILAWRSMEEEFRWKVSYTRNLTQEQRDDLIQQFHALRDIR